MVIGYTRKTKNPLIQLTPPKNEAFIKNEILTDDDSFKLDKKRDDEFDSAYFIKSSNSFVRNIEKLNSFFIQKTEENSHIIYHSEPEKSPPLKSEIFPHVVLEPEAEDNKSITTKLVSFELESPKPIELEFNKIFGYGFIGLAVVGFEIIGTLSAFASSNEAGVITFIGFNLVNSAVLLASRQQIKSILEA